MRAGLQPLLNSGYVLGFGLGGFFDGIVLHQLLQWHHLVSNVYPTDTVEGLELNTLWDGVFHLATYAITVVGLYLLWRAITRQNAPHTPRALLGAILIGFGVFHLFDSIVNHWLLQIHHIREGDNALAYDIAFFVLGFILIAVGRMVMRRARTQTA
jgi:uncharacterized membrane protein